MKKFNKAELATQAWIIDNYKDNPNYTLFTCLDHGVFARANGSEKGNECPHCKKESEVFNG